MIHVAVYRTPGVRRVKRKYTAIGIRFGSICTFVFELFQAVLKDVYSPT